MLRIELGKSYDKNKCDGCGEKIRQGSSVLTGIDSCCGGCYRHLCEKCVERAAILFGLIEEKK